jgi:ketosteroid isomerase-like protein
MWSTQDPLTLFGATTSKSAAEVRQFFRDLTTQFSDCTAYRFELVAAGVSGDLAYTVGYEHTTVSIDGTPVAPYVLRDVLHVTHLYRREGGDWKIVTTTTTHPRSTRRSPGQCEARESTTGASRSVQHAISTSTQYPGPG